MGMRGGNALAVAGRPRLFTVDEYYEMARVGILKPDERVELLDGGIVRMTRSARRTPGASSVLSRRSPQ
jgi:hypothetical protein